MKYLNEYRDADLAKTLLAEIKTITKNDWHIMEICGGQTHSLVKNGIIDLLPPKIHMIHGPGCPVCVTPISLIDKAINLALRPNVILCSFGDMLRVPGSEKSLLDAKVEGAQVKMVYSPLDAVLLAKKNPDKQIIFFAVGFETTAPANALAVLQAEKMRISNFSLLTSHVLVPPAMEAILSDSENKVDAFLAAGHVCTIMGIQEYYPINKKYNIPIVVTGFEPFDLLQGILMVVNQLEKGNAEVENQYSRVVSKNGNPNARKIISSVFDIHARSWRGLGQIPNSGYELKSEYVDFDARFKFNLSLNDEDSIKTECQAGNVLKGIMKPFQCPHFGNKCTPENPMGAPMVSSEGACAAYYHYYGADKQQEKTSEI